MKTALQACIRTEMQLAKINYRDLSVALEALGVAQSESNLRSKISNGTFSAQFFVFVLMALGTEQINLNQISRAVDGFARPEQAQSDPNEERSAIDNERA